MSKLRVAVYIDGGNTYQKLKLLGIPKSGQKFSYSHFIEHLVGKRNLVSKRYYIGVVRNIDDTEKSERMVRSQQKFLSGLESEGFIIKRGKIMYDAGRIREKGVDVKLALDIAIGAFDDLYDIAIIVSSDTDLIPSIQYVRNGKSKNVEYVGFGNSPSYGLIRESSESRIFSSEDLNSFEYAGEQENSLFTSAPTIGNEGS
jgi:uncharacterized LabA/DUF88 family protein